MRLTDTDTQFHAERNPLPPCFVFAISPRKFSPLHQPNSIQHIGSRFWLTKSVRFHTIAHQKQNQHFYPPSFSGGDYIHFHIRTTPTTIILVIWKAARPAMGKSN